MWQCVITVIIHTNTECVTFNSDNDFAPVQVYCNSRYNKAVNNDTHNLFDCPVYFKQYCMVIEHVNTTVFGRKKIIKKTLIFCKTFISHILQH